MRRSGKGVKVADLLTPSPNGLYTEKDVRLDRGARPF